MPVFQQPFLQNSAPMFEGIQIVNARLCRSCIGYADNNTKEAEHAVGSKCSLSVVKFFGQGQGAYKRDTCICRWQRKFQSLRSSDLK